jgi:hypothetical protein
MGELRFFDLSDTVKDYNLDIFIETGTGEGGAIDSVLKYNFKKLFSIEIVKELYDKCVSKFKNNSNIELLNLDSYEGLNIILNKLNKSVSIVCCSISDSPRLATIFNSKSNARVMGAIAKYLVPGSSISFSFCCN